MKFPRIGNPLFAATLVIVSVIAFAEPVDTTIDTQTTSKTTSSDCEHDGLLTSHEQVCDQGPVEKLDTIDRDDWDSRQDIVHWQDAAR